MWIDITPLRNNRHLRLLFIGELISFLGSMVSYVAVPYRSTSCQAQMLW